ncbi:uncharacterized protein FIBRA_03529 [Fibroporia radiculosa]|uniref:Uncharacterized protein n=1 Tax=Fibroporia radiculosa TaxID=599839 RepID=J4GNJ0_9APHY|nr:uncharacterized protein FIBRA_03529 [Fibroporia radiculosa]CCM01475.1 predicted protein [Fibroporia radiculosa]
MSSRLIVNTPYYSARQYVGGAGIGIFLDDAATDGVPGRRPPPMKPPIEEGMINVFEQADEETVNNWKRMLGKILVEQIVRPDVKRQWDRFTGNPDSAALHDFPRHYVLWVHKTGKTYDLRALNMFTNSVRLQNLRFT